MIVFKPETVTKINISIQTAEDAAILRLMALWADKELAYRSNGIDPSIQFMGVDVPINIKEFMNVINSILTLTHKHSKEFIN